MTDMKEETDILCMREEERISKEKETKQETSLGMINDAINKKDGDWWFRKMRNVSLQELKSQLQTYFKNEKLEIEKGCGGKLQQYPFVEQADKCGYKLSENIYYCIKCEGKLIQLEKTEKDILGEK